MATRVSQPMSVGARLLTLAALASSASAQAVATWQVLYDTDPASGLDSYVQDIAAHPGGGVVALANDLVYFPNTVTPKADVVRWSDSGQLLWATRLPGSPMLGKALDIDAQGVSYVLAGTNLTATAYNVFALDSTGAIVWGQGVPAMYAQHLYRRPGGDLIVVGSTPYPGSEMIVTALSATGQWRWSTVIPGSFGGGTGTCGAFDSSGDVLVAGSFRVPSNPPGGISQWEIAVARLDSSGQLLWSRSDSATRMLNSNSVDLVVTPTGDAIVGGHFNDQSQYGAAYVARYDSVGNRVWSRTFTNLLPSVALLRDITLAPDDSVWAVTNNWFGPELDLLHYDAAGNLIASRELQPAWGSKVPVALRLGSAGQVLVAASPAEATVLEFDGAANLDWSRSFVFPIAVRLDHVAWTSQGRVVFAGATGGAVSPLPAIAFALDFSQAPDAYCTGKTNSQGCVPVIAFSGVSSAAQASGLVVSSSRELNHKPGMFLYSIVGQAATPFQGGVLCLATPVRRSPQQDSGGSPLPAHDCTGVYSLDFNAFAQGQAGGSPAPELLVPGTRVWVQAWGRDQGFPAPSNSSLSNGLSFVVLP